MGFGRVDKGKNGEREVCDWLNGISFRAIKDSGLPYPGSLVFQRNQNQTAEGGSDIVNPCQMCIEVKRQETLDLNAWWIQVLTASKRFGGVPMVVFRQNGKRKWNVMLQGLVPFYQNGDALMRVTISHEDFETFAYNWMKRLIETGTWKL